MDWDTWSKILVAALGTIAAGLKIWEIYRARSARLSELKSLMDIANLLPDGSDARDTVTRHVEIRLASFVSDEQTKRRDPTGISLGLIFIAGGGWLVYTAITTSPWWWFLAAPVLILGGVGFTQDVSRRERDARGRPLKAKRSPKS
ncbi:hypothetical protein [Amycolatopsis sp. NPDC098790]|uniref:hypothetical protein n=1 Tax=Amycolatopsis sp. NPDC098790 TaxID=3363939 RepID=UPI0038150CEC